jgi:methionyl-tRNA formyltransferase
MKLLIFVSKDIGLSLLNSTLGYNDEITLVIGNENRSECINFAAENDLKYLTLEEYSPDDFADNYFDWLLNLWGSHIFQSRDLAKAKDSLNVHPSYLPSGRGRDPIIHSLLEKAPLGASLHRISLGVDEGPIFHQSLVKYIFPFIGIDIYSEVIECCRAEFERFWPLIRNNDIAPSEQETSSKKTHTRKETEDRRIQEWKHLSDDQRSILEWISAYDFGSDYRALILKDDKKYHVSLTFEEIIGLDHE